MGRKNKMSDQTQQTTIKIYSYPNFLGLMMRRQLANNIALARKRSAGDHHRTTHSCQYICFLLCFFILSIVVTLAWK